MTIQRGKYSPRQVMHVYEVRRRTDKHGVDLISDMLPFGSLWNTEPNDAIGYATFYGRSHDAVIRVYYEAIGRPESYFKAST